MLRAPSTRASKWPRTPRTWLWVPWALLAAGCGGGDEPEPPADAPAAPQLAETAPAPLQEPPIGASRPWGGAPVPRARIELEVAGEPVGVLFTDLDGDGRERLVALTQGPGRLVVWDALPSSGAPLAQARAIPVGDFALGPRAVSGQRGERRLAIASREQRALVLFERAAPGPLAEVERLELGAVPRAIAAGTLEVEDAAGLLDRSVVATALSGGELVLWRGGPTPLHRVHVDGALPCALAISPDGDAVIVGDQGTRTLRRFVLRDGELVHAGNLELTGIPRDLLELDVDGDGDRELLVAGGDRELWIFGLQRAGGVEAVFADAREPRTIDVGPIPMRVVPLRKDGEPSPLLAVLAYYGLSFTVLEGFGGDARLDAYAGQSPWDLAVGDLGDGRATLAIANRGAARVSLVYPDNAGAPRIETRVPVGPAPHSLALGDLDGDGHLEIVALCSLDGTLALVPNGAEGLGKAERRPAGEGADDVVLADIDGDGNLDAAWLARGADGAFRVRVASGDGRGGLAAAVELDAPAARSAGDLLATDLDGDGRPELVLADPDAGLVFVRRGADGAVTSLAVAGGPNALASLSRGGQHGVAVALHDAGERGGIALLFASASEAGVVLEEVRFVGTGGAVHGLAAYDLDGDGEQDLVALVRRGDGPGRVHAFLARGGRWEPLAPVETGLRPFTITAGDLGSDGVVDVFVSAQNSHHINRWIVATEPTVRLVRVPDLGAGTGSLDLVLADVDGDGKLDLVVANAFSDDLAVLFGGR